jgi:hypothetical protein
MTNVAKDKGGDWHFDGDKTYWCLDAKGNRVGKIYKEYIPDPVAIWQAKCLQAGVSMQSQEGEQLKPSKAVFDLWEHKNANTNK